MKRRDLLRAGFNNLARVLPAALAATGSLGRLLSVGAGRGQPPEAASFPSGNREVAGIAEFSKKEEV